MVHGYCGSRVGGSLVQRRENHFCQGHFDPGWGSENKFLSPATEKSPQEAQKQIRKGRLVNTRVAHWEVDNFLSSPFKSSSWTEHKFPLRVRQVEWGHSGNCGPRVGKESKAWTMPAPPGAVGEHFFPPGKRVMNHLSRAGPLQFLPQCLLSEGSNGRRQNSCLAMNS